MEKYPVCVLRKRRLSRDRHSSLAAYVLKGFCMEPVGTKIQDDMHASVILARPDNTSSRSFASWVTSDIWLVPFNPRTPVVTEFGVKIAKG